jgi:hypothetical protein
MDFFYFFEEKDKKNYLFYYKLGTYALNTKNRLEKRFKFQFFFIENAATHVQTKMH